MINKEHNISILDNNQRFIKAHRIYPYRFFVCTLMNEEFSVHDNLEIIYVLDGSIKVKLLKEEVTLNKDEFYIINASKVHRLIPVTEDNLVLGFQMNLDYIENYFKLSEKHIFDNSKIENRKEIGCILLTLYLESLKRNDEENFKILGLLLDKLRPYLRQELIDDIVEVNSIEDIVYSITKDISDNNFDSNINLNDLAEKYNVSYAYLSRKFKHIIGMNLTEYLRKVRLNRSIDLLINTDKNITAIAVDSGFSDVKAMNRDYQKDIGLSPTEVRSYYKDLNKHERDTGLSDELIKDILKRSEKYKDTPVAFKRNDIDIDLSKEELRDIKEVMNLDKMCLSNYEGRKLVENRLDYRNIKFKIKYKNEKYHIVENNNYLRELTIYDFDILIESFANEKVYPVFNIDFLSENIHKISYEEVDFFERAYGKFGAILEHISMIMGTRRMEDWRLELNLEELDKLDEYSKSLFYEFIEKVVHNVEEKIDREKVIWGANFGRVDIEEDKYWFDELPVLNNGRFKPNFYVIEAIYKHNEIDINRKTRVIKEKLNLFINEMKSLFKIEENKAQLIVNLNYMIHDEKLQGDSSLPYYNILLNLIFLDMGEEKEYIYSHKVINIASGEEEKFELFNRDTDLNLSAYYILRFLYELETEVISIGDGYIITKKGSDIYVLFYGDFEKTYVSLKDVTYDLKNKIKHEFRLNLNGLHGRYKFTEFIINYNNSSFYNSFLRKTKLQGLNRDEKNYIESMSVPEMKVIFKEVTDGINYQVYYNLMDIIFIKCEKV